MPPRGGCPVCDVSAGSAQFLKCSPAGRHVLIGVWRVPDSELTDARPGCAPENTEGRSSMVNDKQIEVYDGIDTHADTHHVAVNDAAGRRLADVQVPTTAAGYRAALRFLGSWPGLVRVGIECTGSYGAAVTRAVRGAGITVVEVNRPNRFDRRLRGKTDVFDAYSAAEAVLSGRATAAPKGRLRAVTFSSSRCGCFAPPGLRRCRPGPQRSIRSRACRSPHPSSCAHGTVDCRTRS